MKKIASKTIEVIDDVSCDVCGKNCKDGLENIESALLTAYWGFTSKKDGQNYEIDICEECFDKTLEYLSKLKGSNINPISENNL